MFVSMTSRQIPSAPFALLKNKVSETLFFTGAVQTYVHCSCPFSVKRCSIWNTREAQNA